MGQILEWNDLENGSVKVKIEVSKEEAMDLKGHMKNVSVLCKDHCLHKTKVQSFGVDQRARYFKIPKEVARGKRKDIGTREGRCLRFDTSQNAFVVYFLEKNTSRI